MTLNLVDLFAGIGGVSLAGDWAGFETAAFCEIDPFCQSILRRHWPEVPIFDDVTALTGRDFDAAGINSIDLLHASTPCQPFSTAGKRGGNDDKRALWPHALRIIRECRPSAVLIENVAGSVSLALDGWLTDLEGAGYEAGAVILPAAAVGAPHRRDRVFMVAYDGGFDFAGKAGALAQSRLSELSRRDAMDTGISRQYQSDLRGMAHGIPIWLDGSGPAQITVPEAVDTRRLRTLGNAVVPQQVYPVLCVIRDALLSVREAVAA